MTVDHEQTFTERYKKDTGCTCTWLEIFEGEAGASLALIERDRRCRVHGKSRWGNES